MSSDEEVPLNVKVAAHQAKRKRAEPAPPTAPQRSHKPKGSGGPLKPPLGKSESTLPSRQVRNG